MNEHEEDVVDGALRWLLQETEAESACYFMLGIGGLERFRVEPRGLTSEDLDDLSTAAQDALLEDESRLQAEPSISRWLGIGGCKVILLRGADPSRIADHLRFARFQIESAAAHATKGITPMEHRIRSLSGVAWAEVEDAGNVRVLLSPDGKAEAVRAEVERLVPQARVTIHGMKEERIEEPRARLVAVDVSNNGRLTADVSINWRGRELRGRGFGRSSPAGRSYASAEAVIDAMRPLVETDLEIEGLYQAEDGRDGADVLVATIRVGDDRFAGAVMSVEGREEESGARVVLDALNRRLPWIAGRSGQI